MEHHRGPRVPARSCVGGGVSCVERPGCCIDTGEDRGENGIVTEAADAFALVASEQRIEMLRARRDAKRDDERPLTFSAVHDRGGMCDSGQFN